MEKLEVSKNKLKCLISYKWAVGFLKLESRSMRF